MKPRQKVHSILLISEIILLLSLLALSIIGCIKNPKKYEKIWFCSKILTLKQIIINNMNNTYPFQKFISENYYSNYISNYSDLLMHSTKNECEANYKKCGILDSMKNIMCIPESGICPLNEIKTSLSGNSNIYEMGKYFNYILYSSNHNVSNNIITNITISYEQPKYITTDNFIFDLETYIETKKSSSSGGRDSDWGESDGDYGGGDDGDDEDDGDYGGGDDGDYGGGIGDGGGGWRILEEEESTETLYGNNAVTSYILDKFNEKINTDIYYQRIDNNLYIRNYIGFENNQQMEEFINSDFRYNYKKIFPNTPAIVFGFISTIPFLILIIFAITRLNYKDKPNSKPANSCDVFCSKCFVIFIYMIFFIGFYIYFIVIYCLLHKKKINCDSLKKIRSEIIIEDFIKSFCSNNNFKIILIIVEISLFSISFILFVLGWIVHIIVQRDINMLNDLKKQKYETPTPMSSTKIVQ